MKMMKNWMKIISVFLTIFIVLEMTNSYAALVKDEYGKERVASPSIATPGPKEADKAIQERATPILNAYIWFGYAIALGMVVFIGIKYMLGAADARANMKSAIVGWLIGAFVVFMATTIVSLVLNVASPNGQTADGLANQIVDSGWSLTN